MSAGDGVTENKEYEFMKSVREKQSLLYIRAVQGPRKYRFRNGRLDRLDPTFNFIKLHSSIFSQAVRCRLCRIRSDFVGLICLS
jgi:hypothetical protein